MRTSRFPSPYFPIFLLSCFPNSLYALNNLICLIWLKTVLCVSASPRCPSLIKHHPIRPPDLPLQLLHRNHAIGPEVLAAIQEKQHPRHAEHPQLPGKLAALLRLHPYQLNPGELLLHQRLHPRPQRFTNPAGVIVKIQHKGGVGGEEGLEVVVGHFPEIQFKSINSLLLYRRGRYLDFTLNWLLFLTLGFDEIFSNFIPGS